MKLRVKERVNKLQTFGAINFFFFVWRLAATASETTGGEMLDMRCASLAITPGKTLSA